MQLGNVKCGPQSLGDALSASLQEPAVVLPAETEPPGSRLVIS
ncbi:hypothetical protein ACN24M_01075 [Streptomyces microflavus]